MKRKLFNYTAVFLLVFGFYIAESSTVSAQTTFSYTGATVPIPDGGDLSGNLPGAPVTAQITVSGLTGNISDINFSFDGTVCSTTAGSTTVGIEHSFINDLRFTLTSPAGTSVIIVNNTDGSGNNFCQTVLDDEAVNPIQGVTTAQAPFTGTFTPANPLSAFDNQNPNGVWTLSVQDFFSSDTGNIRAFSLIVTAMVPTAAGASISGRVRNTGRGVSNVVVTMTDNTGKQRTSRTNPFGYFRFDDAAVGETYIFSISSKREKFAPQVVNVNENLTNLDFFAQP